MKTDIHWYCRDRVSSCNMYAVQQDTQCGLMSKFYSALFVSSTCFGPHRSIIRSVLYKLYLQTLVCGNTRTTYQICKHSLYKTLLMMDR